MNNPKKAYSNQQRQAIARSIDWLFTYESWLEAWLVSNKWAERGKALSSYCMCRYGDKGPYSPRNCFIGTVEDNLRERWIGKEKITDTLATKIEVTYFTTELTQYQIAEQFDIDQSYVSKIVNKKRKKNGR
jgi:hypothetical protein